MKKYQCANCGVINKIPNGAILSEFPCRSCSRPLIGAKESEGASETSTAVGLMGGAMFGASIGGPIGAIVGGILGGLIGKEASGPFHLNFNVN
uniref:Glycine zipper n=1 Tax=Candidatus Kentrum sp. FM TaxID=2126340 RepID=A0A450VYS3_9GAMM|nr:MAG: hypothetical protein BECKFM1743A_GA0114220_1010710 [Candidatus Kentron sp. FM]VFJ76290.1 MAG: hypothetical protein BECKFM1743C_GA0114222_109211 [Candidatus Kentron sp. FM]VFK09910.1 MAG: hypothetical protein BECKFM1743B_GA0114221_101201 [Candidatus Kentron sp. FM]